jgi:uncharacterized membrane protein SpoIIM required for sporulation
VKQAAFEEKQRATWEAFERQIERLEPKGVLRSLARWLHHRRSRGQVAVADDDATTSTSVSSDDFPGLYREVCRDLAVATQRRYSRQLVVRLNSMASAGHRHLYERTTDYTRQFLAFVGRDFPRAVRRHWRPVAIAAACFWLPAVATLLGVLETPELIYSVMDAGNVREFETMYDPASRDRLGSLRTAEDDMTMFGFYIANNIGVGFRTFASGIVFGLGSLFFLVYNGLILGAVGAHVVHLGFETPFFSFVIGHGAPELTAIVLSGAAGLMLGDALIAPDASGRAEALRRRSAEALPIMLGVILMLVLAAVLEAFWSSKSIILPDVKYGVGAVLWSAVIAYFAFAGRRR